MISRPTTPQLINAVCAELEAKVRPVVDPSTAVVLDMAVAVLRGASVRAANELAWMREEAEAITALAARLIEEVPDAIELDGALRAYRDASTDSVYLADAQASYERASEVLSCAAEVAYKTRDAGRRAAITALFEQRVAHENSVTGEFEAVGRT